MNTLNTTSPATKMAELMTVSPALPGVLTRMGIPFGFGDGTVEEVCRREGVDPETFLLICSVYAGDGSRPANERVRRADLKDVLKYLRRSHAYYTEVAMKDLTAALVTLTDPCDERHRNIIRKFFNEYKEELLKHLEYEENTVFPQAEAALNHGRVTPDDYEENHSHVEEKLEDLKNLLLKYMPSECGQQDIARTLSLIYTLQEDLAKHILVEDGILVPLVNRRMHTDLESRFDAVEPEGEVLSAREKEILVCVAKGMLNKEIADAENISIHTVIFRTVGCLTGSFILAKFSHRRFFLLSIFLMALAMCGMLFGTSKAVLYAAIALVGYGNSNIFSIVFSQAILSVPEKQNEVSGLMIMGLFGGTIFPLLMGFASDAMGQIGAVAVMAIGVIYLFFYMPKVAK